MKTKVFKLKNGISIKIRVAHATDAQALIDLKCSYIEESGTIPLNIDEYDTRTEKEEELINKYNSSKNGLLLVAEHEGKLIGNIDITGHERQKMAHTAMLGMGLHKDWRNIGLGTLLIQEATDWAKYNSPLELIWLDVYANNTLGFNLYQKMGFRINGRIPKFFKHKDIYFDKISMYLKL